MFDCDYIIIQRLLDDKTANLTSVGFQRITQDFRKKAGKKDDDYCPTHCRFDGTLRFIGRFYVAPVRESRTLVASWQAGKSVPTASDIATIAARYGVSEAYLRGEVDFPESNLSALQRRLMDSTHDLTDDEMRKVIEYVRFVKFLRE